MESKQTEVELRLIKEEESREVRRKEVILRKNSEILPALLSSQIQGKEK